MMVRCTLYIDWAHQTNEILIVFFCVYFKGEQSRYPEIHEAERLRH